MCPCVCMHEAPVCACVWEKERIIFLPSLLLPSLASPSKPPSPFFLVTFSHPLLFHLLCSLSSPLAFVPLPFSLSQLFLPSLLHIICSASKFISLLFLIPFLPAFLTLLLPSRDLCFSLTYVCQSICQTLFCSFVRFLAASVLLPLLVPFYFIRMLTVSTFDFLACKFRGVHHPHRQLKNME